MERSGHRGAVFLSYASQDAAAVELLAEALRAAGVEVWFDRSELVGGDAWDAKIRRQIAECGLFVPVISANTQARLEGYFRIEWKLAAQRTHAMAEEKPFLLPVVIDDTRDADAKVPAEFKVVQWTRLPGGEDTGKFSARVQRLLTGESPAAPAPAGSAPKARLAPAGEASVGSGFSRWAALAVGLAVVGAGLAFWQPWKTTTVRDAAPVSSAAARAAPVALSEAQRLLQQARALIDDDPLAVRENYKSAYELCERATAQRPDDGEAWALLARVNRVLIRSYNERSDRQLAAFRSQVERASRLAPDSVETALARAGFELENDNAAAAKAHLLRVLERAPDERRALRLLIRIEADRATDTTEARRWAERASALPGGDARALVELAWVHWGLNQFPEVRELVERALAIQPTADAYHLKLMVLYTASDLEGARAWLQRIPPSILREDRVATIAYEVQLYSRNFDGAVRALAGIPREILEEGRYFAARGHLVGKALLLAGKPNAAAVEFRAALKAVDERIALTPRDGRLLLVRVRLLDSLGDRAEAERQFAVAREFGVSGSSELLACAQLGRTEEVIALATRQLDRSRSRWPSLLSHLQFDPQFDAIRPDPRMQALIARGNAWLAELMNPPKVGAAK